MSHILLGLLVLAACATALFAVGMALTVATAAVLRIRCPRCGGRVAWLACGWGRRQGGPFPERILHQVLCLRCWSWSRVLRWKDRWIPW